MGFLDRLLGRSGSPQPGSAPFFGPHHQKRLSKLTRKPSRSLPPSNARKC